MGNGIEKYILTQKKILDTHSFFYCVRFLEDHSHAWVAYLFLAYFFCTKISLPLMLFFHELLEEAVCSLCVHEATFLVVWQHGFLVPLFIFKFLSFSLSPLVS